jgi:hypothetical protein
VANPHIPDVTTFQGLCDIMMLGNVCELGVFMQRKFFDGATTMENEVEECGMARWRYRQFQTWFQSRHVLLVNGRCYEPIAAFRRSLVEFMAAVCWHKRGFTGNVPHHKNFTFLNMIYVYARFLRLEYPELLETWKRRVKSREAKVLFWNGPKFEVRLRSDHDGEVLEEFEDFPVVSGENAMVEGDDDIEMTGSSQVKGGQVEKVRSSAGRKRKHIESSGGLNLLS